MLTFRYPWLWVGLGWTLVAAVVAGSLLPGTLPMVREVAGGDKLLHAGSYFVLMVWFAGLYRRSFHALIALGLFALSVALDALQSLLPYRMFDLRDLAANASGLLAGLVLSAWLLEGWCQRLERRLFA